MAKMMHNSTATLDFGRFDFAVIGREAKKPLKSGCCADSSKSLLFLKNSACFDDQTAFSLQGLFCAHGCSTPNYIKHGSRWRGRIDVMQSCEGRGRGAKSQIAPDERRKRGYMRSYWITQKGSCRY